MLNRMVAQASTLDFARHLQLRLAAPDAVRSDLEWLCARARALGAASVCVNGSRVALARSLLEDTNIQVCAAIGFPFGAMAGDAKRYEIEAALDDGAQEFEAVVNHGWLKENAEKALIREWRDLIEAAEERPLIAVLEPGLLTSDEMTRALRLAVQAEVRCVGVATGFGPRLATMDDVRLLHAAAAGKLAIQATVAFSDRQAGEAFLAAGAFRLGLAVSPAAADPPALET